MTKNHGCATLERDHSAQLFILCGLLLATSHHTRVVHDHNLLAGHRHMRRSGRRVCVPPSKPCPWPCGHGGTCLGRSNVRQRVVFCCWGVSWSFGSLVSQRSSACRIQGIVNSRVSECGHFWLFGRWVLARTFGVSVECSDLTCDANTLGCRVWCAETWSVGILPFKSIPHVSACPVCPLSGRGW